ncbi:hypothetical protein [Staphylococcus saprophyticus]|uniref:hypothetical protein n=1 Tax=Staphylococcus saprophyticus TaxID=29385 RepID=UPI0011A33929|nr:hypothetical protein [Staphylococcus saprophyticus]MDW4355198.1 hypothetical protein [Staphylococcus saprophyticus]
MTDEVIAYVLEQLKYKEKVCVSLASVSESIVKDVMIKLVDETVIVEVEKYNGMYLLMAERKPLLVM